MVTFNVKLRTARDLLVTRLTSCELTV